MERAWYAGAWWLQLLRPLELLFRLLVALRRRCYRLGLLSVYRAERPVVVVGNISLGGTGKTPVVIALVEALAARGIRAGVVSRGYGARGGAFPRIVSAHSTATECGDEALQVYQRTGCPCVVAPSRAAAVRELLSNFDVDLVISDDGLQHYALARDLEIAMYDAGRAFANGLCLPAGPLREPLERLAEVDFVLGRGSDEATADVRYRVEHLVNLVTGERREPAPESIGRHVFAVAGVGNPHIFLQSLEQLGFAAQARLFNDHHTYRAEDFAELEGAPIIMTGKDAVKCRDLAGGDAWYLQVSAVVPDAVIEAVASLVGATDTSRDISRSFPWRTL